MRRPDSTYPIIIKPYKLDISQFGEKVRDQMKFTILNVSDKSLDLSKVAVPTEYLSLTLPASVPAGKSVEGSIKLTADAVKKEFEKSLTIQLNDDKTTRFTIPVKRSLRIPGDTTQTAATPGKPAGTK